jgi:hypothetical protein
MTGPERLTFIALLQSVASMFNRRLGDDAARLYAEVLDDVPFDRLEIAVKRLARDAEGPMARFPFPRELRSLARGRAGAGDGTAEIRAQLTREQRRQEWLKAGSPLTPESAATILREVMPQATPVLREVMRTVCWGPNSESPYWTDQRLRPIPREPGEEG